MHPWTRYLAFVACPIIQNHAKSRYNAPFFFGGESTDVYVRHNDWVRSVVPAEKLLEFQPVQGWGPLCKFLDKPVPGVGYPRLNYGAAVVEKLKGRKYEGLVYWGTGLALGAGIIMAWRWRSMIMP